MKLSNVSMRFNNDPIYDAYTGRFLFRAHTKAHDDQSSSGATSRRRTMRTATTTTQPDRRAVRIDGTFWIVGNSNVDSYAGAAIRKSYGLKKSTGVMTRLTPGQVTLGQTGWDLHAHKEFYRDTQDPLTESDYGVMLNIFLPFTEAFSVGQFLKQDSRLYRIRNIYPTVDEYQVAETDELEVDALQSATFRTRVGDIDIATDSYTTVNVTTNVIQTDQAKFYRFRDAAEASRQPGDRVVFVARSAVTLEVGVDFTMLDVRWRVVMLQQELDSWAVQARRL